MTALMEVLRGCAFNSEHITQDDVVKVCRFCGRKDWLIEDIKHKRGCLVIKAMREGARQEPKELQAASPNKP